MKASVRRIGIAATFALLAAFLLPLQAFAATSVTIDGTQYTKAAGDKGGTWSWDGEDALTLDGYSGGGIAADGDLDITLSGKNAITSAYQDERGFYGIAVSSEGNLTIAGDGSLAVTYDGEFAEEYAICGIYTFKGDISITGTTVDVAYEGEGMHAYDGDLIVTDSKVSASSSTGNALAASSSVSGKGNVTISGSDITAEGASADGKYACGIWSTSFPKAQSAPTITIEDSTVTAEGGNGAIVAYGMNEDFSGIITVIGSAITSPEGAHVQSIATRKSKIGICRGCTIGSGLGVTLFKIGRDMETSSRVIVTSVTIAPSA